MTNWKFTDATNRVVFRTLDNGSTESCLVSVISDWIAAGNTVLPAPPPAPPSANEVDAADAKSYAKLATLMAMTPAQARTWATANVTNLAQAQDAIATLVTAVCVLARRL